MELKYEFIFDAWLNLCIVVVYHNIHVSMPGFEDILQENTLIS